jgi:hypothetical protein
MHVLCYLRRFADGELAFGLELERLLSSDVVIGHRCGCGNCNNAVRAGKACTRPEHLDLITQGNNRNHVPLHDLLATARDGQEYTLLVAAVNRLDYADNLF